VDQKVSQLLDVVRDDETAVVVVSDHGAQPGGYPTLLERHTDQLLQTLGFLRFESGNVHKIDTTASLILPGPEAAGMVQFGLNSRQPVLAENQELKRKVLAAFLADLAGLRLEGSGKALFENIRVEQGDSAGGTISVSAELSLRSEDADGRVIIKGKAYPLMTFYRPLYYTSNHSLRGVFIGAGFPFARGVSHIGSGDMALGQPRDSRAPRVHDVMPSVLAAMGLPVPSGLDGRVLWNLFENGFRENQGMSPRQIDLDWKVGEPPIDRRENDEALETLRELGYAK